MDGTTEPIIAVIGHPIAGNPSQFAVERALREMKLEWRVLSFDVSPRDIAAALEGFSVTGIAGVLIDPSVASAASRWYAEKTSDIEVAIDCLCRVEEKFVGSYQRRAWVDGQIAQHAVEQRIWLGDSLDNIPLSPGGFADDSAPMPPDPDLIEAASLIVFSHGCGESALLEAEDWPENDGSTLVMDLTEGHPDQASLKQLGYRVAGTVEQQIGTLRRCLEKWTGNQPSAEVLHDAIEEYFAV